MNLSLGLAAANSYLNADRQRIADQEHRTRFDEQSRRAAAELSLLGDKTAAELADYRARRATSDNTVALAPDRQAADRAGLDAVASGSMLTAARNRAGLDRLPVEVQTAAVRAGTDLSGAQFEAQQQPERQRQSSTALTMQGMLSDEQLRDLPDQLQSASVSGALSREAQREVVFGTLAQIIQGQDKRRALGFINEIARRGDVLPGTNGKTFTDIRPLRRGEDGAPEDGYGVQAANGERGFIPARALGNALQKMKTGAFEFLHTKDGSVYAGNKATGAVTQAFKGEVPAADKAARMGPLQRDVEYLVANHGMSKEQALAHLNSAKTMSREQFVLNSMQGKLGMGHQPTAEDQRAFGALYDSAVQRPAAPAAQTPGPRGNGINWRDWIGR